MEPPKKRNYECDTTGLFMNEDLQPSPQVVGNLAMHFPELPEWMISAAVMFDMKNPEWRTAHDRKKEKLLPYQVPQEWWGETPEEREKNGTPVRTMQEAIQYASDPGKEAVSSESVCRPVRTDENKIEEIVSVI
tara:strand:- start:9 stop:410 length:402 start_codon:yes stop_codon:yes gene_type:complete